jgi:hypothetical protein
MPSRYAVYQNTELSTTATQSVEKAITEVGLEAFVLRHRLERLDFVSVRVGRWDLDSASGFTVPKPRTGEVHPYPWIVVKPVVRIDRVPLGNEPLRAGQSPCVAVVSHPIAFMKCVLVHELGHLIINEAPENLVQYIRACSEHAKNPISHYALLDWEEYFAETLAAHTYYPELLKTHDLIGYNLIREVLETLEGG